MITGYNTPQLQAFSRAELELLASELPKGLTYRVNGGEESRTFTLTEDFKWFLNEVEAKVIWVDVNKQDPGDLPDQWQYENERYIFPPPNIWRDFRGWLRFTFDKPGYYRDLAEYHFLDFSEWWFGNEIPGTPIYNLPLKVNQNAGFKAYAEAILNSALPFEIDLHVFGDDPVQFMENLTWYKNRTDRTIHLLEFSGTTNERFQGTIDKNTDRHRTRQQALLTTAQQVLGDQLGEVCYFCLAANATALRWRNPSYLHRFEVSNGEVIDTLNKVF